MKLLLSILSIFMITIQGASLKEIRDDYKEVIENKLALTTLEGKLAHVNKDNANTSLIAYKGAVLALKSKKTKGVKQKKALFLEAVSFVEHAIKQNPKDIESRFIRLGIQENVPKFLKYKKNIQEDKTFIIEHYKQVRSNHLKKHLNDFIQQSKSFTSEEKKGFSN